MPLIEYELIVKENLVEIWKVELFEEVKIKKFVTNIYMPIPGVYTFEKIVSDTPSKLFFDSPKEAFDYWKSKH